MRSSAPFCKSQMSSIWLFTLSALILSYFSLVTAIPVDSSAANEFSDIIETRALVERDAPFSIVQRSEDVSIVERASAGLFWGPFYVGNLKVYLTNPHEGPCGPKFPNPNTPHVNFHVDKKGPKSKYVPVVNLHIVKYHSGSSKNCLYAWDSETDKVVFDSCFDNWPKAAGELAAAAKNYVDKLLKDADFFAALAVLAAVLVVIGLVVDALSVAVVVAA